LIDLPFHLLHISILYAIILPCIKNLNDLFCSQSFGTSRWCWRG
jgi:hypothetical protein